MSTIYMSQLSAALPLVEGDHHHQDHHQAHFQAFSLKPKEPPILFPFVISSSSSSCPSDTSTTTLSYGSDQHLRQQQQQHQAMLEPQHMIGGSSAGISATPFPTVESIRDDMIEPSPFDPYNTEKLQVNRGSANVVAGGKWSAVPAAKMKITRKTGEPSGVTGGGAATTALKKPRRRAQAYEDHGHGGSGGGGAMGQAFGVIRVCADCNTTKTPLWRSGPSGPKSLCNACGIRHRKARQAMMASGSPASPNAGAKAATQSDATAAAPPKVKKEKRADVDRSLPFKKRCKVVQVQDQTMPATNGAVPAMEETAESATVVAPAPPTARGGTLVDSIGLSWSKTATAAAASCTFRPSSVAPSFAAATVQDEITDAAMLLMTLSCGLVRSRKHYHLIQPFLLPVHASPCRWIEA